MKHKIVYVECDFSDYLGAFIEIDGKRLSHDAFYTYNCLEDILKAFNIDYEIQYTSKEEEIKITTKKMKLVEDNDEGK